MIRGSRSEERNTFEKGGVLSEQDLSALSQLQQQELQLNGGKPATPTGAHRVHMEGKASKDMVKERPSPVMLDAICNLRTSASPNLEELASGALDGEQSTAIGSASSTHAQGLLFRRLRSSTNEVEQAGHSDVFTRTHSGVSCKLLVHPLERLPPLMQPPTPPDALLAPPSLPCLKHTDLAQTPASAPIVSVSASVRPPPKPIPRILCQEGHASRARRLPKVLPPAAALGFTTQPSLCGSQPLWAHDPEPKGLLRQDSQPRQVWVAAVPDSRSTQPHSCAEMCHSDQTLVRFTRLAPSPAFRSASQLLLYMQDAGQQAPPSPNFCVSPSSRHASHRALLEADLLAAGGKGSADSLLQGFHLMDRSNHHASPNSRGAIRTEQQEQEEQEHSVPDSPFSSIHGTSVSKTRSSRMGLELSREQVLLKDSSSRPQHSGWLVSGSDLQDLEGVEEPGVQEGLPQLQQACAATGLGVSATLARDAGPGDGSSSSSTTTTTSSGSSSKSACHTQQQWRQGTDEAPGEGGLRQHQPGARSGADGRHSSCLDCSSDSEAVLKGEEAGWRAWLGGFSGCLLGGRTKEGGRLAPMAPSPPGLPLPLPKQPGAKAPTRAHSAVPPCVIHTPNPLTTSAFPLALGPGTGSSAAARGQNRHTAPHLGACTHTLPHEAFHLSASTTTPFLGQPSHAALGAMLDHSHQAKSLSLRRSRRVVPMMP